MEMKVFFFTPRERDEKRFRERQKHAPRNFFPENQEISLMNTSKV